VSELPASVDVAIIGGGFAGLATAWALGRRGVNAIVLERETVLGKFASGRGAGLGRQLAEDDTTTALTIRGAAMLRTDLSAAWTPTSGVLGFDDAALAEAYTARAHRHGLVVRALDRDAVLAYWNALDGLMTTAGLFVQTDGVIDVKVLLQLYAANARVELACGVSHVAPGGNGAQVMTTRGTIEARVVVDASGAWAGALTGDAPLDVFKRHLYVLEAASRTDAPWIWHLGRQELYARTDGDGVLVSVCDAHRETAGDAQPDEIGASAMRAILGRAAPDWDGRAVKRAWACQRAFTPERAMRIGRDPTRPWLVWAAGLGGHGATASAAIGESVADAIGV
jgi:glycine/D-amino acid oxidase-like deaminating enzyme